MIRQLLKNFFTFKTSPSQVKSLGIGLLLILAFTSCSKDNDDIGGKRSSRQYTNTILVYMPWTGSESSSNESLTSFFQKNIKDIKTAIYNGYGSKETRTIVFFANNATDSRLYEINDDSTETTIKSHIPRGALTSTDDLESLLNEVYSYSPTNTYSIIIGSHGSGWLPAGTSPLKSRSFGGIGANMQTDVTTLADAINRSDIKKMEYICFDDCYMANIETVYALRNATNWLVASTCEIMSNGLPYTDIWEYLSSTNVNYSAIVSGFGNYYSADESTPSGTLSAIDCSKADQMASLMRDFNQKYSNYSVDMSRLQPLDGYPNHVYYDMGSYINERSDCDTTDNKQIYEELKELVPFKFTTPRIFTAYQGGYSFVIRQFSGIAVSDPSNNESISESKKETGWWKATH